MGTRKQRGQGRTPNSSDSVHLERDHHGDEQHDRDCDLDRRPPWRRNPRDLVLAIIKL
jgi:hypothetical protein